MMFTKEKFKICKETLVIKKFLFRRLFSINEKLLVMDTSINLILMYAVSAIIQLLVL